jgi:hypothetical protein
MAIMSNHRTFDYHVVHSTSIVQQPYQTFGSLAEPSFLINVLDLPN